MDRVVYRTTCALYLAQRVLKQLIMDDEQNYPLSDSAVSSDLISVSADIYSAKQLKEQLIALFRGGGMQLHKWSSNCIDGNVSLTISDETKALRLGRLKLDWNYSLPIQLESQWKRFVTFLSTINILNISRYILLDYDSENRTARLCRCF
ncbi:hypothetical protein AVEN_108572-1 [Araneus ventricosus]|uniref:Uncharacterized protein n=1 Tax=Araneus ventricosus TaxID=182803 RepID=A0A4Y2DGP7_ARAVE|nr:hypothetical protein AVEN_108572-1 [Araneus ventricosus]